MRLEPSIQGLLPESLGIVCLKLTGLVPGRRLSAWGSSIIHHGGSGAPGKKSASKALAHREGLRDCSPRPSPEKMSGKLMSDQTAVAC